MTVPLSALNFNYNPEGRGSVILVVMLTLIQFVSRLAAPYTEPIVSQQFRALTSTHSALNCGLPPSVYMKWISMIQDKTSSFALSPSHILCILSGREQTSFRPNIHRSVHR